MMETVEVAAEKRKRCGRRTGVLTGGTADATELPLGHNR
eukprot:SAG11_NODE_33198_length_278_cov_1.681564_1_plen_38_part_01